MSPHRRRRHLISVWTGSVAIRRSLTESVQRIPTIARRQVKTVELLLGHPCEVRMLQADGFALDLHGKEVNHEIGSGILDRIFDGSDTGDVDAQFLLELATGGLKVGLARLELTARKLPEASVPFVRRAETDKQS
jgi:hypothetical protein